MTAATTPRRVRPYAMTAGRTCGGTDIPREARVQATPPSDREPDHHRWETAELLTLVEHPMTLAEIAERLGIPIGVARVLVADLVEERAVCVSAPKAPPNYSSRLEQVLDGVRTA